MSPEVPEGSIVITPKEFYDGVSKDIRDIKTAVSPLPGLRQDVDDLQHRMTAMEKKFWWAAGFCAAGGSGAVAVIQQLISK